MGVLLKHYLTGTEVYVCSTCKTHLSLPALIMSKAFTGAHGRAYLFKKAVNVDEGQSEERELLTGKHLVCDVTCIQCKSYIGWKYIKAYSRDQEYKTGAYVLEKALIILIEQQQDPDLRVEDNVIPVHTEPIIFSDDEAPLLVDQEAHHLIAETVGEPVPFLGRNQGENLLPFPFLIQPPLGPFIDEDGAFSELTMPQTGDSSSPSDRPSNSDDDWVIHRL